MTDEIKMCKADRRTWVVNGFEQDVIMSWEPLDPQPSCETCAFYLERLGVCSNAFVEAWEGEGHPVDKDFFCSDWEMKK